MGGLNHGFLLLSTEEYPYRIYRNLHGVPLYNSPHAISLHDDVIIYIEDTLKWINSHLPHRRMKNFKGLDRTGLTVINADGAVAAKMIFHGWARLFATGPERLKLTGNPYWRVGDPLENIKIEQLVYNRDDLVERFEKIGDAFMQVCQSAGRLYVLHLGL